MDEKELISQRFPQIPTEMIQSSGMEFVAILNYKVNFEIHGIENDGYVGPKPILNKSAESYEKIIHGKNYEECQQKLLCFMNKLGEALTPLFGEKENGTN